MTDLYTLIYKETYNFLRLWKQTLIPSVISIVLYFAIFGKIIGDKIDIDYAAMYPTATWPISYIDFIFPGLLMMSVIMWSYALTSFGFFTAKMFKSLEELLISPISINKIIIWYCAAGLFRGIIVAVLVFIAAMFMVDNLRVESFFLLFTFVTLTGLVFSLAGLMNAIYAKSFDDVNIIPSFVITPLIYLGGVFYSVQMLPPLFETISKFNPILYMINGLRYAFIGVSDVNIYISLAILIVFSVALYWGVYYLLKKGKNIRG